MGRAKRLRAEKLPAKLLQIRKALGLSQNELIRELGFDGLIYQANISEYESGKREPPLPILLAYARSVGVSLDVLADDELQIPNSDA